MNSKKLNKNVVKTYDKHKKLFKKYFFINASSLFLEVFESSVVEKIVDHFVVYGDSVLYSIGIFLIEEIL